MNDYSFGTCNRCASIVALRNGCCVICSKYNEAQIPRFFDEIFKSFYDKNNNLKGSQ